mgnify:CR=1 FL=1
MQSKVLNSFFQKFFLVLLKTTDNGHFLLRAIGFNARSSLLIAIALGIEAASFWSEAEKDIAESPTAIAGTPTLIHNSQFIIHNS